MTFCGFYLATVILSEYLTEHFKEDDFSSFQIPRNFQIPVPERSQS